MSYIVILMSFQTIYSINYGTRDMNVDKSLGKTGKLLQTLIMFSINYFPRWSTLSIPRKQKCFRNIPKLRIHKAFAATKKLFPMFQTRDS